jgi:hypothetical protein
VGEFEGQSQVAKRGYGRAALGAVPVSEERELRARYRRGAQEKTHE